MKNLFNIFITILLISFFSCGNEKVHEDVNQTDKYPYPEEVYGDMFKEIQMKSVFPDSKTFADARAKVDPETIMLEYRKRKNDPDFDAKAFVEEYWEIPSLLSSGFKSDSTKTLTEHIESLWLVLTRDKDVAQEGSTRIPLPYSYVVPGGRFREIYYWDSYFTMLGLKESGEDELIMNMLDNFAFLIDEIGHIPNGSRTYFVSRSQPPFFAQMVKLYAGIKGDEVYKKYLPYMQKEYDFWMRGANSLTNESMTNEHTVFLDSITIANRYYDSNPTPRQESYIEDIELVEGKNKDKKYGHLRAACESGWDFSSRWMFGEKDLETTRTGNIIPVDLNALLYGLEDILEKAYSLEGNPEKVDYFKNAKQKRIDILNKYHWNEEEGVFMDYNFINEEMTGRYTAAMFYPLFFNMASKEQAEKVVRYAENNLIKAGGILTTTINSGQQWDAPNGWPPLQWITLVGLDNYGYTNEAKDLAQKWTSLNEKVYKATGKMVEKYNVVNMNLEAGGGEYPVQDGFGWSNGVYLAMKAYLASKP